MKLADGFRKLKEIHYRYMWWILQIILIIISLLFLGLGILVLVSSYHREDPFSFILGFFASNLIILISVVLLIGFCYRIISVYKKVYGKDSRPSGETVCTDSECRSENENSEEGVDK